MLSSALAFLAGNGLLFSGQHLPDHMGILTLSSAAVVCLCLPRLRLVGLFVAGFCWAAWHTLQLSAVQLPPELEGRDLQVRGQVVGLPEQLSKEHTRLRLHITAYGTHGVWRDFALPVRLNWYRQAPDIHPGERWQLQVRLKAAHGYANPGGFDYQRWLFAHRIRATGYIRKSATNRCLRHAPPWGPQQLRYQLSHYLQQLTLDVHQRALLRALAIGDRAGMSPKQWQLLQHTGTTHLLAISGLHVGLVAGLVFFLVNKLWSWLGGARRWPAPRAAALAAMVAALLYALLAGFQVPAQRALIMVWVWMLSILLGVRGQPWQVWGLALWLVLLIEPLSVLTAGFWLSFSAVALILYLGRGRHGDAGRLRPLLALQLKLMVGLTPLVWLWFQQASWVAPLANLLAIPWVSFLVVPLLLLGLLLLPLSSTAADGLMTLAAQALDGLWAFLQWLDPGAPALWPAPALTTMSWVLGAIGLLLVLLPRGAGVRAVAVIMLVPTLTTAPERPAPGDLWLTLLDVGQGLAVVVETARHALVYDTGPAYPGGFDAGTAILIPFLRQRGYHRLDRLVISHGDNDHSGGGHSLLRRIPVYQVDSGEPQAVPWANATDCHHQPPWRWDGVQFNYLRTPAAASGNNASCVLKVTTADGRAVILPGDIEQPVERALVVHQADQLAAEVLIAPHHGSRSSSTPAFIRAVKPAWVLFATGYRNRFGFPKADVVARYRAAGAQGMDSATAGAIDVRIETGRELRLVGWRQRRARLWWH